MKKIREYSKILASTQEWVDFMRDDTPEWNHAPSCDELTSLCARDDRDFYLSENNEIPEDCDIPIISKPVYVEGDDGIMYAGTLEANDRWHGKPTLFARFALGRNQNDPKYLNEKMETLGFNFKREYFKGE